MINPSEEQLLVLEAIQNKKNVVITAIPGAGKTTQIMLILSVCENLGNTLVLTYNRKLKIETKEKIQDLAASKFFEVEPEVHTFHSFCQNKYGVQCHTDRGILKIVNENLEMADEMQYDFLVVDECQDMTELYFKVIKKIWHPNLQLLIVGDPRQSIYGYNGADPRYLTLADKILGVDFEFMTLSTSYRMTERITKFLNNCILGENLINPSPAKLGDSWPKPKYIIDDPFRDGYETHIFGIITSFLLKGYQRDDIFILCPSTGSPTGIKSNGSRNPIQRLANFLSIHRTCECKKVKHFCKCNKCCACATERCSHNINIFVPGSDDVAITKEDTQGKVVFCTFHKAKGLERKIVIVLGFDLSYHKYYNKDDSPNVCCNPLYVALTRSMEHLIIVQTGDPLPFVKLSSEYVDIIEKKYKTTPKNVNSTKFNSKPKCLTPHSYVNHMKSEYITNAAKMITLVKKREPQEKIRLSSRHKQPETIEIVCEITGSFIVGLYEYEKDKTKPIYKVFGDIKETTGIDAILSYDKDIISKLLKRTTEWTADNSGFMFKKIQIRNHNWISPKQLDTIKYRMLSTLPRCQYTEEEVPCWIKGDYISGHAIDFVGRMDIVDKQNKIIWEIKCTEQVKDEHILQLAAYKYINLMSKCVDCRESPNDKCENCYACWRYFLFNVKDNSIQEILISDSELVKMMEYLIDKKYRVETSVTDQEFISKNI